VIERTVGEDQVDQRLDKFLRRLLPQVPQSHIYKLLRLRRVRVNGLRAREDTLLQPGDRIVVRGDPEKLLSAPAQVPTFAQRLTVLYEDADLMAIDKPAGLAIHPGSGIEGPTVVELARAHVGPVAAGSFEASPAHRLDRDTSGVVLVAKTRKAMVSLTEMFTAGTVHKRYLALAKGRLPEESGVIDVPLQEHEQTARSRAQRGVKLQEAITHWQRLSEGATVSLLACRIETGRTHQIRRHLAAIGHPVAGDRRHGDFVLNRVLRREAGLRRMFLHAQRIALQHPLQRSRLDIQAALPAELVEVLGQLGLSAESALSP
jgi:23S rRNA pseudouridine955/2504/2580 synthase